MNSNLLNSNFVCFGIEIEKVKENPNPPQPSPTLSSRPKPAPTPQDRPSSAQGQFPAPTRPAPHPRSRSSSAERPRHAAPSDQPGPLASPFPSAAQRSRPHSLSPLRDADRPGPPASAAHSARRTPRVSPDGPVPHASAHARTLSPTRCHAGPARQRPSLPFRPGSAQRPPGITGELAGVPIPPQSPPGLLLTTLRRHLALPQPHEALAPPARTAPPRRAPAPPAPPWS